MKNTADNEADSRGNYFKHMATQQDDSTFDEEYNRYLQTNYFLQTLTASSKPHPAVSVNDVIKLVRTLKPRKALDIFSISSEHITLDSPALLDILACLINKALETGKLPDNYKLGSICSLPKKSKPPKSTNSYRRITIPSIASKVVELHMITLPHSTLDSKQSQLQFNFTCGNSHVYAVLVLMEVRPR